jgi:MoaA/NifB/PqqE/SkfB family radical SAM enzyme
MKINLMSLAPDSFILGSKGSLDQFYPKKVLNISSNRPWGLEIHLTSHCQLNCEHCSYGQRNKDHSELSSEAAKKILESAEKLKIGSVIFSGGGDPLAWSEKNFDNILKKNASYSQAIATNGLGFMETINEELLKRVDIIQINVNGYDRDSFLQNTRRDQFDTFIENLGWLFENSLKGKTQITGKIVMDRKNYHQVKKYLEFCYQLGFDLVVVKLAGNFEAGQNVNLTLPQKAELRKLIYESPVISEYPEKLDAIATEDNAVEIELPSKCWVVERGLYILIRSNGDVFPCVTSPYTTDNRLGNIHDDAIEQILGSAAPL